MRALRFSILWKSVEKQSFLGYTYKIEGYWNLSNI